MQLDDVLHRLPRNDPAKGSDVVPGPAERRENAAGIAQIADHEAGHVALRGLVVEVGKGGFAAGDADQRGPAVREPCREVDHQVGVLGDQPRGALGALQIPTQPVGAFGRAGKGMAAHYRSTTQVSLLPPPWDEFTTSEPFRSATRVSPPMVT